MAAATMIVVTPALLSVFIQHQTATRMPACVIAVLTPPLDAHS
jgi:hypothetical protein